MTTRPQIGTWLGSVALDNHEPTRDFARIFGEVYAANDTAPQTVVLTPGADLKDAHRAVYLLDDGQTIRPHYVAGWNREDTTIYLHPFPTSTGTRPDGRPVDMSNWFLGPRRAYHVKLRNITGEW